MLLQNATIILDTCILGYIHHKNKSLAEEIFKFLANPPNNTLVLSEFTYFELLDGVEKTKEAILLQKALNPFKRYVVDSNTLVAAAQLSGLYNQENQNYNHIERGDKIIAATSVITNLPILTANANDFPRPFFKEVYVEDLFYLDGSKKKLLLLYTLMPNLVFINNRFGNRK